MKVTLGPGYQSTFEQMLGAVAAASHDPDVPLVPFWPLAGAAYNMELLAIGRSVNGWVEDWTASQLRDESLRRTAIEFLRRDAEPREGCRMAWVTDRWGAPAGYNTARSAFWRVLRRLVLANSTSQVDPDQWASSLVWTNLYKVSPASGWNPGGDLQRAQRQSVIELLRLEIDEFKPRRVLAMTGTWIDPFVADLGLSIEPRSGLVEGVGSAHGAAWVVAKHPMGKPGDLFVAAVSEAFADLGRPLE